MNDNWRQELETLRKKKRLAQLEQKFSKQDESFMDQAMDVGSDVLDYGLRGLDYLGGAARTGINATVDAIADTDTYKEGDFDRALVGKAPDTAEILERAGMDNDYYSRTALGLAGDIATDPLTYLSLGALAGPKLAKLRGLLNQGGKVAKKGGKKFYKSAFNLEDMKSAQFNKKPVSDILWENNIMGSRKAINEQADSALKNLLDKRNVIYDQADELGVKVSPADAMRNMRNRLQREATDYDPAVADTSRKLLSDLQGYFYQIKKKPDLVKIHRAPKAAGNVADDIGEKVFSGSTDLSTNVRRDVVPSGSNAPSTSFKKVTDDVPENIGDYIEVKPGDGYYIGKKDPTNIRKAEQVRKNLRDTTNKIKSADYDTTRYSSDIMKKYAKEADSEYRQGVIDALNKARKGLGDNLAETNSKIGGLATVKKDLSKEAIKEARKKLVSQVDGGLLMASARSPLAALMLAGKTANRVVNSPLIKTYGGKALYGAGKSGVFDVLMRQGLIDANREDYVSQP